MGNHVEGHEGYESHEGSEGDAFSRHGWSASAPGSGRFGVSGLGFGLLVVCGCQCLLLWSPSLFRSTPLLCRPSPASWASSRP